MVSNVISEPSTFTKVRPFDRATVTGIIEMHPQALTDIYTRTKQTNPWRPPFQISEEHLEFIRDWQFHGPGTPSSCLRLGNRLQCKNNRRKEPRRFYWF